MPMRIPPDAKVIRDSRITLIRVISTLYDRLVNGDDGLKDKVKATMREKDASFAESDLVIAALRAGSGKSTIDVYKLYRMVDAGVDPGDDAKFLNSANPSEESQAFWQLT
jgi:hypothetical protein